MQKKITLLKDSAAAELVGAVAADDATDIVLVIPKFSQFVEQPEVFQTLKKVADSLGKQVVIESVDDTIIHLAKAAGIDASNPFFESNNDDHHFGEAVPVVAKKTYPRRSAPMRFDDDAHDDFTPQPRGAWRRSKLMWCGVAVLCVITGYWLAFKILPRAEIVITTKKTDWAFNNLVMIDKNSPVPSHLITDRKNAQMVFPALGKKMVSQKAIGKIVVYNAYSSQPQQLVATTRFATEDGKIIRLTKNITIPGAVLDNGQIVASSLDADVIADKPGPDYNIGPVKKLIIPGFKGTPKFTGFYAEIKDPLKGGFVGETAYPTEDDIKNAKVKSTAVLHEALLNALGAQKSDYVIVRGSDQITLVKTDINPQVNGKGEFSLFAEAELKVLAFKEDDLVAFLRGKMREELGADYVFTTKALAYDFPKIDFTKGSMSLPVDFKSVAELPVDVEALRPKILGKSEEALQKILFEVPNLTDVEITLWPGYLRSTPRDPAKTTIVVN